MIEFYMTYNAVDFENLSDDELQQAKKYLNEAEAHQMEIHKIFNILKRKINDEISKRNLDS